jgi:hydrogenase maturation protein HypF
MTVMPESMTHTYLIEVRGLVQGVGFRPFIYRLAHHLDLKGWVKNTNESVLICLNANEEIIDKFITDIKIKAPRAAEIFSVDQKLLPDELFTDFSIIESSDTSEEVTEISPDIAVCDECLADMESQTHRINYPFLNCTNCGPRFTIIKDLPYDRENTTMADFKMCSNCRAEYENVLDRRFHAQPVACHTCGPEYELIRLDKRIIGINHILNETAALIDDGKIIAVKGQGGFHLACDALNEEAVHRLRMAKYREGKPFAVMFRDIGAVAEYTELNNVESEQLNSWRRPIVILEEKKSLAPSVSDGLHTIGAMLPYMPFHYLLFKYLKTPVIVLTSGNLSDEPIMIDNDAAVNILGKISDAVLVYNRDIYNRTDDSVVMVVNDIPRMIRRSRGYVPNPVRLGLRTDGILAAGAELVNCYCLGKGNDAILSQHIGDLKNFETYSFYIESIAHFQKVFRFSPEWIAHDLHPDYLSTKYAVETGFKRIPVQHHHAHIASALAENGLDEKVIGVSFDGTGYGDDGHIWGGEFLVCDLTGYQRNTHFRYLPMPGGDLVTTEPWRMAVSYLYDTLGTEFLNFDLPFLRNIDSEKISIVVQMMEKKINTPLTSSCGRLFDAISALTGICPFSRFHAEAPMRLENEMIPNVDVSYPFIINEYVDFSETIRMIVDDIRNHKPAGFIAVKFHNTIISLTEEIVKKISTETGLSKVVLSGGSFQNRYLLRNLEIKLRYAGYQVYTQHRIPSNDGGIALGQIAIAAKRREVGNL